MRLVLAFAIAALGATTAVAQSYAGSAAGDRYGYGPRPRPASQMAPQTLEAQGVHALSWSSKATPQAATPAPVQPRPTVAAYAGLTGYGGNRAALPPAPSAPRWRPNAYQPFTPQAPYQAAPLQVAALTTPPLQILTPARAAPPAPVPAPPARAAAAPMPSLAGPPPPSPAALAPQQVAQAEPRSGEPVHFYSVHRGYSLTPDAIPEPSRDRGYVLIGPSASAPKDRTTDRDDDDDTDKSDRPF